MSLNLNNSRDVTCDKLFLLNGNNVLQNVLTLIAAAGNGIETLTGSGSAIVTGSGSSRNILVDLSAYTNTASLNALLNAKQDNITAGTFKHTKYFISSQTSNYYNNNRFIYSRPYLSIFNRRERFKCIYYHR